MFIVKIFYQFDNIIYKTLNLNKLVEIMKKNKKV